MLLSSFLLRSHQMFVSSLVPYAGGGMPGRYLSDDLENRRVSLAEIRGHQLNQPSVGYRFDYTRAGVQPSVAVLDRQWLSQPAIAERVGLGERVSCKRDKSTSPRLLSSLLEETC